MDYSMEYQTALELASSLRYTEAKQKLESIISEYPNNMDPLILLGKVEYYLRLFPSSRRHFETVLSYDPGNFEAYYGLQFFIERKRRLWTITAWIISIFLLLSIAVLLNISIRNVFNRFERKIDAQSGYYLKLEKELSDRMLGISDNLDNYHDDLDELKESLLSEIGELNDHVDNLDFEQEERLLELQDTQVKYYRTILEGIRDLNETVGRLEDGNFDAGSLFFE